MSAPICYVEISAPDLQLAEKFYQSVFAWHIQKTDILDDYLIFSSGEGQLSGGFVKDLPLNKGNIVLYIQVDDIPETLEKISIQGEKTIQEKQKISDEYGFCALFVDPNGNHMGLWSQT